jgi:hypothetical protein
LHSNRDYEVGIVYLDEYARASSVLVSEYNTVYVPPQNSILKNKIQVSLNNYAPYWAKKYKFVLKPSKSNYETIFTNFFYTNPFDNVTHFKLDGDNQQKVQTGDKLIVKKDVDGALSSIVETTVLEVKAQPSNFLDNENELGAGSEQLAGLYMQLKVSNFNATIAADSVVDYGEKTHGNESESTCNNVFTVAYPLYTYTAANGGNPATTQNYSIPGGSVIKLKFGFRRDANDFLGCPRREIVFDQDFVAGGDYTDFRDWFNDTNIDLNNFATQIGVGGNNVVEYSSIVVTPTNPQYIDPNVDTTHKLTGWNVPCQGQKFKGNIAFVQATPGDVNSPLYFGWRCTGVGCGDTIFGSGGRKMEPFVDIVVQRADATIVFETQPADASEEIFYDASRTYDIVRDTSGIHLHQSGGNVDEGEQNQTLSQDAVVTLDFMDCYSFGNGVESFKILDRLATRSVVIGQRALAESNQDFKEADRFASVTYSGRYGFSSGVNNLNEFNLGLVNFQDVETSFGPIMKLHGRETDILCLQEDRISYILSGKDLISDSVGGGAIVSTPSVLGKQIARVEEYGISYNPESFVQWGKYMYFTDTKRLAVIRLGSTGQLGSGLELISDTGMRSWFRDTFIEQLNTQKLGGFDPYMDEYVLSTNLTQVPIPIPQLTCGVQLDVVSLSAAVSYVIDYGSIIGTATITYAVPVGSVTITVLWNGNTTSSGPVAGTGNFTFNKSASSPTTATITITPVGTTKPTVTVTPQCIPPVEITVIKCLINSPDNNSETIHTEYRWDDGVTFSPVDSDLAVLGNNSNIFSEYNTQTGVRSQGVFPYDGVNLTIRLNKINFDNYDWTYPYDNFRYLSSNTLYQNNQTDVTALLAASTQIANGSVTNPSPGLRQATLSNLSIPINNQYLYLIYDLRTISAQQLCYDASSADDACCLCSWTCTSFSISSQAETAVDACPLVVGNTNYHSGAAAQPAIGDVVYTSSNCQDALNGTVNYAEIGFYKITGNKYIQIGTNGLVLDVQNC